MTRTSTTTTNNAHARLTGAATVLDREAKQSAEEVITVLSDFLRGDVPIPRHALAAMTRLRVCANDAASLRAIANRHFAPFDDDGLPA